MKKIYLHIGMHKTGSTSLQESLVASKQNLNQVGWDYIHLAADGNSSIFVDIKKDSNGIVCSVLSTLSQQLKNATYENNILSGEHFFAINDINEIARLKEMLSAYFSEIKVVIYLRRQDKIALSFKQQATKGNTKGYFLSSFLCGHSVSALPELSKHLTSYLDYSTKLKNWSTVFGKDNLIVSDFDCLHSSDICIDFSHQLNLPIKLKIKRINEGVGRLRSLILHKLLDAKVSSVYVSRVRAKVRGGEEKILPTRSEAIKFCSAFSRINKSLSQYDIQFDKSFDKYPEDIEYKLNLSDADHMIDVLASIGRDEMLGERDIDTLRDTAILLENSNIKAALSLMEMAHKLRPSGAVIKQKLEMYKKKSNR